MRARDTQAIVSGMASGEQVQLQFSGLIDQTGFFGREQATYLLDGLFNKVKPSGFERLNARKSSAERQYVLQRGGPSTPARSICTSH